MVLANISRMSRAACSGRIAAKNRKEKEAEFIRISKLEEVNDLTKFSEVDTKREIRKLQSFTGTSKLVHSAGVISLSTYLAQGVGFDLTGGRL